MQLSTFGGRTLPRRRLFVAMAALAAALAGCTGFGESKSGGSDVVASTVFGAPNNSQNGAVVVDAAHFGKNENVVACPPVSIRPGTEEIVVYEAGKKPDPITGDAPPIQFRASIVDTARECSNSAGGVAVKLGVKGRVVAGPAGKAGTVSLPIRVAVLQGTDTILKSQLFKVAVSLQDPDLSANFSKIFDTLEVPVSPGNTDFRILVGFDEGEPGKRSS